MDISDPKMVWSELLRRINATKERGHPTGPELAALVEEALERQGVPDMAWKYVGERIRDEVHRGDGGRPPNPMKRWAEALNLEIEAGLLAASFTAQGRKDARGRALGIVARGNEDRTPITADTLRRKIRRNLSDLPPALEFQYRDSIDFKQMVREMQEEGLIRLDPDHGFVWLNKEDEDT